MKPLSSLFLDNIDALSLEVHQKRLMQTFVSSAMVFTLVSAVIAPNQSKHQLGSLLGLSSILGLLSAQCSESRKELELRYKSYLEMNREKDKQEVAGEFKHSMKWGRVMEELKLAASIRQLPPSAQERYAQMFQLQGLGIGAVNAPKAPLVEYTGEPQVLSSADLTRQLEVIQEETGFDTSWINDDFINKSKAVIGAKGSGKTYFMHYLATRWKQLNPEGIVFIFDSHFDPTDPKSVWFAGVEQEPLIGTVIFKKHEDIRDKFKDIQKEIHRRIENNLKPPHVPKIKIFWDEEDSYFKFWNTGLGKNPKVFEETVSTVATIQDECRKYGIDITIGMHSIKLKNTGIDSSTLAQMTWVMFEKACMDINSTFPSDFELSEIKPPMKALMSELDRSKGRAVIVLDPDRYEPIITALPLLPVIQLNVQSGEGSKTSPEDMEMYKQLIEYCRELLNQGEELPTIEEIQELYNEATERELDKKIAEMILEQGQKPLQDKEVEKE